MRSIALPSFPQAADENGLDATMALPWAKSIIDDGITIHTNRHRLVDDVHTRNAADVAIVHIFVVIVDRLHYFVANSKDTTTESPLQIFARRIQRQL